MPSVHATALKDAKFNESASDSASKALALVMQKCHIVVLHVIGKCSVIILLRFLILPCVPIILEQDNDRECT